MSARRIPVNAAALLVARIIGAAAAVAVVAVSAHRLDLDEFGLMASTMAAGFLANSLVTFGTDTVVTRAIAAEQPDAGAVARASLKLQIAVSLLFVVVAAVAYSQGVDLAVLVQAVVLLPFALATVAGAVLRGRQRMDLLLIAAVAGAVVALISLAIGFALWGSAWVPIAALGMGSAITALCSGWFARTAFTSTSPTASLVALARETAPFAAMVVLAAVGAQSGLLLVEFATEETAGGYGAAVRLSEAARLIPAAAMGAFFPAMLSGLHRTAKYRQWISWLVGYAVVATVGLLLLASPLNRLVFDDQPGGAALIRILALGLLLTVARLAMSFELIAARRERVVLYSALAGAAVTVIGGFVMAGPFGAQGIAWSQLAGLLAAVISLAVTRTEPSETATPSLV